MEATFRSGRDISFQPLSIDWHYSHTPRRGQTGTRVYKTKRGKAGSNSNYRTQLTLFHLLWLFRCSVPTSMNDAFQDSMSSQSYGSHSFYIVVRNKILLARVLMSNWCQNRDLYTVVQSGTQWLFDCTVSIVWIVCYRCCCSWCCSKLQLLLSFLDICLVLPQE